MIRFVREPMSTDSFTLRFNLDKVKYWARRYSYPGDLEIIDGTVQKIKQVGFLNKKQLLDIGLWKSQRIKKNLERNTEQSVEEITKIALSAQSEYVRIGVLTLLHGVRIPVASAVLHFCHEDKYPILDYRALWSLGFSKTSVNIEDWLGYIKATRGIAEKAEVDMRTLDKALWQFSKENQ
jgi:hypothetical protein